MALSNKATLEMIQNILNGETAPDEAEHAANADEATHAASADSAEEATHAAEADHATSADSATTATNADYATAAGTADEATHATSADSADEATHATSADTADKLGSDDVGSTAVPVYLDGGEPKEASAVVNTNAAQTISGVKTFSAAPKITASLDSDLDDETVVTAEWVRNTEPYVGSSRTYPRLWATQGSSVPEWMDATDFFVYTQQNFTSSWASVFASNSSGNQTERDGYVKFRISNYYCLQICFGTFAANQPTTFANPFNLAPFVMTSLWGTADTQSQRVAVSSVSTTEFTTESDGADTYYPGYYIAIGYTSD